jgi:hypothetical protein
MWKYAAAPSPSLTLTDSTSHAALAFKNSALTEDLLGTPHPHRYKTHVSITAYLNK